MRSILPALVVLSGACAADDADMRPPPVLRDAQCQYDEPGVRCAYLDVPAKRSDHSRLIALWLALAACDDERASVPVDESLCAEERDYDESYCGSDEERIDSTRALALLRERYPGAQIYWMKAAVTSR